jgi:hypothetical protein
MFDGQKRVSRHDFHDSIMFSMANKFMMIVNTVISVMAVVTARHVTKSISRMSQMSMLPVLSEQYGSSFPAAADTVARSLTRFEG